MKSLNMAGNILFVLLHMFCFLEASELPEWHMKPLGSHTKPDVVDEVFLNKDSIITGHDFAKKYVMAGKPIVFRNVVKSWPAYKLWTDEYLSETYGDMEMRLEAKKEKRGRVPKGDVCLGRDRLRTFLKDYTKGVDKYVVSELPTPMWSDVYVPPPMACGEFLESYVEIDVWMNSDTGKKGKGGNSLLHKDAYNTVNCVLNGTKEWKLIELQYNDYVYQSWEGPLEAGFGGFSLINPDSVDAKEYPKIGKLPRWQFVTINAGDCLFVPSQMWHQVKSYGATNRAVAFLFSQYLNQDVINTTGCDDVTYNLPLSEVDVDLQYPGKGMMSMGNTDIKETRNFLREMVDETSGKITKKGTLAFVYQGHEGGAINKKLIKQQASTLYQLLLDAAGGDKELMTESLIANLTRDEVRATWLLTNPIEPSNSYNYEYSNIYPENIVNMIRAARAENNGKLEKEKVIQMYEDMGGTRDFGERLWTNLAGDKLTVENISETLRDALRPYIEHRTESPDKEDDDDGDATIITPQGHVTQPKKRQGGYTRKVEDEDENEERNEKEEENKFAEKKDEL